MAAADTFFGHQHYDTSRAVAYKMLAKIDKSARYILEPTAGRGMLAEVARGYDAYNKRQVDCIESDPDLSVILRSKGFNVVGHDWLTYEGVSFYDAIVANFPFSQGAEMALRAWDFLYAGEIVCLLNKETLKNPLSEARKRLLKIIETNKGEIEYMDFAFSDALRKTDVGVAMVYLKKVAADDTLDLWAKVDGEETVPDDSTTAEPNWPAIRDRLGNMQHYYDQATAEMFKAFQHIRKARAYMAANDISFSGNYDKILEMASGNLNTAKAAFVKQHNQDGWMQVFKQTQFHKWLDKKQSDAMLREVQTGDQRRGNTEEDKRDGTFLVTPFTKENIHGTLQNILASRGKLFEQSVVNVFDELTRYFNGNTNHTEGWKTNDSYKVNERLVFPYGCRYEAGSGFSTWWGSSSQIDFYNDLDRVLCVLDKKDFEECLTIARSLDLAFDALKSTRGSAYTKSRSALSAALYLDDALRGRATSQYFDIRFYKKGTVHLKWRRRDLWEAFSLKVGQGKKWIGSNTKGNAL